MDGLFLRGTGMGIGGIFRDSCGKIFIQFGKEVSVESALHTELLAFREGILVAAAS